MNMICSVKWLLKCVLVHPLLLTVFRDILQFFTFHHDIYSIQFNAISPQKFLSYVKDQQQEHLFSMFQFPRQKTFQLRSICVGKVFFKIHWVLIMPSTIVQ